MAGKTQSKQVAYYNLDMILAIGYRVYYIENIENIENNSKNSKKILELSVKNGIIELIGPPTSL